MDSNFEYNFDDNSYNYERVLDKETLFVDD